MGFSPRIRLKTKKSSPTQLEWDFVPRFRLMTKIKKVSAIWCQRVPLQFKHLSSGCNVLLEKSNCIPGGACTPIREPL